MLLRKITWFWKSGLAAISFILILSISGCSDAPPEENIVSETVIDVQAIQEESEEDADEIISVCIDLYEKAEEDTNMQNHEKIEAFYADYLNGQDSMVTVFEVHRDGLIGAVTFIYRKEQLQTYYIGVRWKEGGMPEIQGTSVSNVAEIKLTEKGYFIYAYEYVIAHASLRQYWRIEPLPEGCRELTEKYVSGLSYVNYNVLVTNWDSSNVEDILMPCMYEEHLLWMEFGPIIILISLFGIHPAI